MPFLNSNDTSDKLKFDSVDAAIAAKANQADLVITNAQLADNASKSELMSGVLEYGELTHPSDFPIVLPFTLYRDFDGRIKHNFDFANIEANPTKTIYINGMTGNDTTGDGTEGLPYLTINKGLTVAESAVETKILLIVTGLFYEASICRQESYTFTNKTIILKSATENTRVLAAGAFKNTGITWTPDGTAYKGLRPNIQHTINVVDLNNKDIYGIAKPLTAVSSVALCQSTPNSYYCLYSDVTAQIWVHRFNGSAPDVNLLVLGEYPNISFTLNSSTLYTKDFEFYSCLGSAILTVNGDIGSAFYHKNCIFGGSKLDADAFQNGLGIINVGKTFGFNSFCAYTGRDGFNYHYPAIPTQNRRQCLVFEYDCGGHDCGANSANVNNNVTTAHEGVVTLRIGSIGYRAKGPNMADVGGCYSLLYDCKMRDSLDTNSSNYEGYDAGGVLILINCESSGARAIDIGCTPTVEVRLKRFNGNKLGAQIYTVLD